MANDLRTDITPEQTTVEHITDLRKLLIRSIVFFLVMFIGILFFMPKILPLLKNGYDIVLLGPQDVIRFYAGVAGAIAIGLTSPFLAFQVWKFVKPALTPTESKMALTYVPGVLISFCSGVAFGYFVVFPILFNFLMNLGEMSFEMMVTARQYFSFMLTSTLTLGLLFELPMAMAFLTSLGIVTPKKLQKLRKHALLVLAIISALITPPDFISQLFVLVPLVLLYELGIYLSKISYKKKIKKEFSSY